MSDPQQTARAEHPVALVTGAGRRLGNAIARHLAQRGYRVALHAHDSRGGAQATVDELSAGGREAIALSADLADEGATRRMVAAAHDHFGRIDALVNNAAIWESKPFDEVTAADVRSHFEINTLGAFICAKRPAC